MEGPSLFLAEQQLKPFEKKVVLFVDGNTKLNKERLIGKEVIEIFSWGKHLVFQFDTFALRVHFLLFGTFEATVDNAPVTGDYKKKVLVPRLAMKFENGHLEMYSCSIKMFDDSNLKQSYNFATDIMSSQWDHSLAMKNMANNENEQIADVLLDQEIFSGVGNIIKNEVLSIERIHPLNLVKDIPIEKLSHIIDTTHEFSQQFYRWRKEFKLRAHLRIHRKKLCPHCSNQITREKTGKRQRWSYYCLNCQALSSD